MSTYIAIEGPDRVGKHTQANLLKEYLLSKGKAVLLVEVPVKDKITHPVIYWMLRNGLAKNFPKVFQWLQVLNRKFFEKAVLSYAPSKYDYVIFDRWSLSTLVYGLAEGLPVSMLQKMHDSLLQPDATVVLLGHIEGLEARDSYEKDLSLQKRVGVLYRDWAVNNESIMVNASQSVEQVHQQIVQRLVEACLLP